MNLEELWCSSISCHSLPPIVVDPIATEGKYLFFNWMTRFVVVPPFLSVQQCGIAAWLRDSAAGCWHCNITCKRSYLLSYSLRCKRIREVFNVMHYINLNLLTYLHDSKMLRTNSRPIVVSKRRRLHYFLYAPHWHIF